LHLPNGKVRERFDGQFWNVGDILSTNAGGQQIDPPPLLFAAVTVKFPKIFPIENPAQLLPMVAFNTPLIDTLTSGPANLSFGMDPVNENSPPGFTCPLNIVPIWSTTLIVLVDDPLNCSVSKVSPPEQLPQLVGGGQSQV
jgi:hypothetical protein